MSYKRVLIFLLTSAIIIPWLFSCGEDNPEAPGKGERMFERAVLDFREGKYDLAMEGFQDAASVKPEDVKPLLGMAWCYLMKGDEENAKVMLDKAVEIKADDPELNAMLCWRHLAEGKYKSAVASAQKALASDEFISSFNPSLNHESMRAAMALAYFHMRDYASAAEILGINGSNISKELKAKVMLGIEDALR
jgi:Flp pilus assembly protein TadD